MTYAVLTVIASIVGPVLVLGAIWIVGYRTTVLPDPHDLVRLTQPSVNGPIVSKSGLNSPFTPGHK